MTVIPGLTRDSLTEKGLAGKVSPFFHYSE